MNPQQYPPPPGQTPGYPGPQGPQAPPQDAYGGYAPPQPYPGGQPAQPGQWQAQPGPQYPTQPAYQQPVAAPGPAGYNPYAYPGEYEQQPKKGPNKALIIGVVAVVVLVIIIAAVLVTSGGNTSGGTTPNDQQGSTTQTTTSTAGNDIVPRSDNTLDLSKKINNKDTLKAQTLKAKTSEQVNLSSGFSFMVTKTEAYTPASPTTKPADGKKFIAVTTVVGNRNETGNISVSYLDFRLRNASNQLLPGSAATNEILNNPLASPSELKPGEQLTGKVVFEVDANDTSWVFKHSETYQKTTDDTTFTVEGEIVAQLATASPSGTSADTSGGTPGTTTGN